MANQLWVVVVPPPVGEMATVNVNSPSVPVKKLTDVGADYIAWADGGATITWGLGASFFRQPLSSVLFEAEKKEDEKEKKEAEETKEAKEAKEKEGPGGKDGDERKETQRVTA